MRDALLTVADLQRLHLHHLRHGPPGLAANIETLAALRGMTVAETVAAIAVLASGGDLEAAAWAQVVTPFVEAAIAAGALTCEN